MNPADLKRELNRPVIPYDARKKEDLGWMRYLPIRKMTQEEWEQYQIQKKERFRERCAPDLACECAVDLLFFSSFKDLRATRSRNVTENLIRGNCMHAEGRKGLGFLCTSCLDVFPGSYLLDAGLETGNPGKRDVLVVTFLSLDNNV